MIAKMDATQNDAWNLQVQAYPTIVFYRAGEDKQPVFFQGPHNIEDLAHFIAKLR
jgi:thioredoxin-like negative regulator of GroEL